MSSKPGPSAKYMENVAISAGCWGRHRDCRAAESPAYCRHSASVPGFPDRPRWEDTARRRIAPVYRQAARRAARSWRRLVPRRREAAPAASACNHSRPREARFGQVASPEQAEPGHWRRRRKPPSGRMRKGQRISFASGTTARARGGSADACQFQAGSFRPCGNESAKNGPSAASAGARSG
jgi:hypothetical protein